MPIRVVYWTAWVDENGEVQFRRDVYDRDNREVLRVEERLAGPSSGCTAAAPAAHS